MVPILVMYQTRSLNNHTDFGDHTHSHSHSHSQSQSHLPLKYKEPVGMDDSDMYVDTDPPVESTLEHFPTTPISSGTQERYDKKKGAYLNGTNNGNKTPSWLHQVQFISPFPETAKRKRKFAQLEEISHSPNQSDSSPSAQKRRKLMPSPSLESPRPRSITPVLPSPSLESPTYLREREEQTTPDSPTRISKSDEMIYSVVEKVLTTTPTENILFEKEKETWTSILNRLSCEKDPKRQNKKEVYLDLLRKVSNEKDLKLTLCNRRKTYPIIHEALKDLAQQDAKENKYLHFLEALKTKSKETPKKKKTDKKGDQDLPQYLKKDILSPTYEQRLQNMQKLSSFLGTP
eukprot:TRINITY_DN5486_c1_g1_i1.p1 TRINITY_DN5486_c1_g1~~TRINITY_DN5486_c1_g1_i1.p1  ORF type:complete len:346 (-),score=89.41 TRINITY_DN5486_c1_g1_i1:125-1162(-)